MNRTNNVCTKITQNLNRTDILTDKMPHEYSSDVNKIILLCLGPKTRYDITLPDVGLEMRSTGL